MGKKGAQALFAFWFFLAALIGLIGLFFAEETTEGRMENAGVDEITVKPGDSLWSIASWIAPKADPRATIEWIARANRLTSTRLQPGQRLLVPRREPVLEEENMMCLRRSNPDGITGGHTSTRHSDVSSPGGYD